MCIYTYLGKGAGGPQTSAWFFQVDRDRGTFVLLGYLVSYTKKRVRGCLFGTRPQAPAVLIWSYLKRKIGFRMEHMQRRPADGSWTHVFGLKFGPKI